MGDFLENNVPDDKPNDFRQRRLYGHRLVYIRAKSGHELYNLYVRRAGRTGSLVGYGLDVFCDSNTYDCRGGTDCFELRVLSAA